MDILTENNIKKLNVERTWATELIAAVGQFLDKAQDAKCPKLKASCDELITCGLAMITHHTKQIAELRAGEPASASRASRQDAGITNIARMPSQMHTQKPAPSVVAGRGTRR